MSTRKHHHPEFKAKVALEALNRKLKKMYAEMSMQNELLKEALGKKP